MNGLDLLAFGPHPDDLEIGLGGTIAKHAALGHAVGLCDLTRGEMSSNGTPDVRVKEADAARKVLGAAWRENLALPDRAIGSSPDHIRAVVELIRRARPRAIAVPYWQDRHPDHESSAALLRDAIFNAKLKRYDAAGEPFQPEWVCLVRRRRVGALRGQAAGARVLRQPVFPSDRIAGWPGGNASKFSELQSAHREPRCAVRGAGGRAVCRRYRGERAGCSRTSA
jgi:LmbE family N-acetylglucosaminyl deacetylase